MPNQRLPDRPSLEYLRKLAKQYLAALRQSNPQAQLAQALLAVASDHGFPSWRALKAEVDRRLADANTRFFAACEQGDTAGLSALLTADPRLVEARDPARHNATGLHTAAARGHAAAVRLFLDHHADPNLREPGDNTTPLHWAAARGHLDVLETLLDAGADPRGLGDVHELDVIGWATYYCEPPRDPRPVVHLLTARGARHHVFSALRLGDPALIQRLVEDDPEALDRRLSHFDHRLTPLHYALTLGRPDLLELLLSLGADPDGADASGRTPLAAALLRGDQPAIAVLRAAGATEPAAIPHDPEALRRLAPTVHKLVPMIHVPDIAATLDWYTALGFRELGRFEDDGVVNFGMVAYGKAEIMFNMHGRAGNHDASLWLYTEEVDALYRACAARQMHDPAAPGAFVEDLNDTFYGTRQFGIRDLNGYILYFAQPLDS